MASKGLKLIQNGVITYAPNTAAVRAGIEGPGGHNQKTKKSARASQEHITILEASDEEVELYLYPSPKKQAAQKIGPTYHDEIAAIKAENSELKTMMLNFMAAQTKPVDITVAGAIPLEQKRGPGRPPANNQ